MSNSTFSPSALAELLTSYHRTLRERSEERLQKIGCSLHQFTVLSILSKSETMNVSDIASITQTAVPTATILCKRLEDLGFVKRKANPLNRRATFVTLTTSGKLALKNARKEVTVALNSMIKGISKKDVTIFSSVLLKGIPQPK